MAVPPVVVGLALLILLGESFVGKWLVSKNIQLVFDMKGVVVAQITVNLPFAIIQTMEHYEKIEPRIYLLPKHVVRQNLSFLSGLLYLYQKRISLRHG